MDGKATPPPPRDINAHPTCTCPYNVSPHVLYLKPHYQHIPYPYHITYHINYYTNMRPTVFTNISFVRLSFFQRLNTVLFLYIPLTLMISFVRLFLSFSRQLKTVFLYIPLLCSLPFVTPSFIAGASNIVREYN